MKKIKIILTLFIFTFMVSLSNVKVTNAMSSSSMVGKVVTNGTNLNVRQSASTSSKIITKLKNNTLITIISTHDNFYKVEYKDNQYGYVHKNYISKVSSTIRKVSASTLNVRSGPSTNYRIIDKLKNNELVATLSLSNSFYKIIYDGTSIGYVHKDYVNFERTTTFKVNVNVDGLIFAGGKELRMGGDNNLSFLDITDNTDQHNVVLHIDKDEINANKPLKQNGVDVATKNDILYRHNIVIENDNINYNFTLLIPRATAITTDLQFKASYTKYLTNSQGYNGISGYKIMFIAFADNGTITGYIISSSGISTITNTNFTFRGDTVD